MQNYIKKLVLIVLSFGVLSNITIHAASNDSILLKQVLNKRIDTMNKAQADFNQAVLSCKQNLPLQSLLNNITYAYSFAVISGLLYILYDYYKYQRNRSKDPNAKFDSIRAAKISLCLSFLALPYHAIKDSLERSLFDINNLIRKADLFQALCTNQKEALSGLINFN